jgi:hypothetical protein
MSDRGDVILIDTDGKSRALSKDWESLEGLVWPPSGKELWFSAAEAGGRYCVHAADLRGKQRAVHCGTAPTVIQDITANGKVLVSAEEQRVSHPAAREQPAGNLRRSLRDRWEWNNSENDYGRRARARGRVPRRTIHPGNSEWKAGRSLHGRE